MKKNIIYILCAAMAIAAAASCSKSPEWNEPVFPEGQQGIFLKFNSGSMVTKADEGQTVPGKDYENYVKRIDFFIFPMDSLGTDNKLYVSYDAEYILSGSWEEGTTPTGWTYTSSEEDGDEWQYKKVMTADEINEIFPNGADSAKVFAVANYCDADGNIVAVPTTDKTWKGIRKLEVGSTFYKDGGTNGLDPTDPKYEYYGLRWPRAKDTDDETLFFVMTGEEGIKLDKVNGTVGKVGLARLASKVTVEFTYEEVTDDKGIKWIPQYPTAEHPEIGGEARMYLSNAIDHVTLGGPLTRELVADSWGTSPKAEGGDGTRDVFEYAYDYLVNFLDKAPHYYTYPIQLKDGDDNQPYLKLVLPWYGYKNMGTADAPQWVFYKQKEVYYKIVLPAETITESNKIYQYKVTVNIVGNDQEVEITGEEYIVMDWLYDNPINSNVALGRYISLDIPKDEYDMYSSKTEILFVSSGEVEISELHIYKMIYTSTSGTGTERYYINGGPTSYVNPYNANTTDAGDPAVTLPNWAKVVGNKLVINHTLNTDLSSNLVDITPYTFVVKLHLVAPPGEDTTPFDRTVTITQYPPIYLSTLLTSNQSTVFLNGRQYSNTANTVNNNANESLGTIGENGGSTARTKTIVSVSTLAELDVTEYSRRGIDTPVIGDPRVKLSDAYPVNPGVASQTWETNDLGASGNNYIADYMYAGIDKSNVIAPKFMLSSGYGSCAGTKVDWIHNVERCASYQEDGYPAGRWRLPTEAEIIFVYHLAHDLGLVSNPFYDSSNYWANSGRRIYGGNFQPAGTGNYSSRCVYDLWYWGDDPVATGTAATQWSGFQTSK